jgi:hypothetical protein
MATSNRPITLGRSEVGLGLRRSTSIALSDGKNQGEPSPSCRSAPSAGDSPASRPVPGAVVAAADSADRGGGDGEQWYGVFKCDDVAERAEKPIFGLEKIDAMAWAVTTIPVGLKLNNQGVRVLRTSGIRPSGPLGRG